MIARAVCATRIIFYDIIFIGHYLESLALFLWRVRQESVNVLETRVIMCRVSSLICKDISIGRAICIGV